MTDRSEYLDFPGAKDLISAGEVPPPSRAALSAALAAPARAAENEAAAGVTPGPRTVAPPSPETSPFVRLAPDEPHIQGDASPRSRLPDCSFRYSPPRPRWL